MYETYKVDEKNSVVFSERASAKQTLWHLIRMLKLNEERKDNMNTWLSQWTNKETNRACTHFRTWGVVK